VPAVVEQPVAVAEQPVVDRGELVVAGGMTVREFAARLGLRGEEAVSELVGLGVFKSLNEMLTVAEMAPLGARHGYRVRLEEEKAEERPAVVEAGPVPRAPDVKYVSVPPVVAVLGHVDHGKTSLLDYIRRTDVTAREHGGITQHIGASEVERDGKRIVFIDTPGHEAFTQLRARGAQVTDLALLLVAADDGVMPQTLEALQHARAAGVPIIVVVNKIDLEGGDPQRVRRQLGEQGLVPEEWGGETIFVDVSAKNGQGVDTLLDMILLLAEMRELKAPINVPGAGIVIESALDPARGPLASVLVKEGRLRKGDVIVCGTTCGRVRRMTDWLGSEVPAAAPAKPVELCGLTDVPRAGSRIEVVTDPRQAKALARYLAEQRKQETAARLRAAPMLVETAPGRKELLVVLKADAQGSLEAVTHAVERLGTEEVKARFIYQGIGNVAESDVMLAGAGQALVLGFNVRADAAAQRLAKQEGVVVLLYSIIYELTEAVHASLEGLLEPEYREVLIGRVEVRRLFFSARSGTIAGCYVLEGRAVRGGIVHVTRNGEVVYSGPLTSLRHLKDDVRQMEQGFECGIVLDGFNVFQEGDVVEVYEREQVARTLR
jgi:translation initiation factor IF-2